MEQHARVSLALQVATVILLGLILIRLPGPGSPANTGTSFDQSAGYLQDLVRYAKHMDELTLDICRLAQPDRLVAISGECSVMLAPSFP